MSLGGGRYLRSMVSMVAYLALLPSGPRDVITYLAGEQV